MEFTAKQIAMFIGGEVAGDDNAAVSTFSKIEEGRPGSLTFLSNPKYTNYIYETEATIVLVSKSFVPEHPVKATLIRVDDPYDSLARLMTLYESSKPRKHGIDSLAFISPSAKVGKDVYVAPFAYVGDGAVIGDGVRIYPHCHVGDRVEVGDGTTLYANVSIYEGCRVGRNCTLHSGVVIGADGFGFAPLEDGTYKKSEHTGNVVIGDDVEIGACTTIDKSQMGSTVIGKGVKIDNLCQIAHNVEIGDNTVIAAQSGIAGSTKIGKHCVFGGQVGVAGHITIADNTSFGAQSGVLGSVKKEGQAFLGTPAIPYKDYLKSYAIFKRAASEK